MQLHHSLYLDEYKSNINILENLCLINLHPNIYSYQFFLLKLDDNIGIIFGDKYSGEKNYIDVSKYFSRVYTANFSSIITDPTVQKYNICQYQDFKEGKVLYNVMKIFEDGSVTTHYSPLPDNGFYCSCSFFIVGALKKEQN